MFSEQFFDLLLNFGDDWKVDDVKVNFNPHCSFNCNLFTKSGKKAVDKLAFAHMVIHKIMICSYLYFWI